MGKEEQAAEVLRILRCKPQDFFAVLGIDPKTAEFDEVKKAHKRVVLQVHPDKCQGIDKAKDAFAVADAAYKKLSDEGMFTRFRDAFRRKSDAMKAAMDLAAGKAPAPRSDTDEAAELERQREEKYLAAVREHREHEAKRHRAENERKATEVQKAEIEEQLAHYADMKRVFGTTRSKGSGIAAANAMAAAATTAAAAATASSGGLPAAPMGSSVPVAGRPLGSSAPKRPVQR